MSDHSLRLDTPRLTLREVATRSWVAVTSSEALLIFGLLVVALGAHGVNMFDYPPFTYKDDEGIYASQAWAVLREGRLSPYTYWYDHAPAGWVLVAAWMAITGGPDTFGGAIDSGRVLMLILHLAMVPLLFHLARKLGCSRGWAAFATLLFSVSPIAILNQRMLLLDNIMMFWVLLSLNLLLDGWGRLSRVALSGTCFALALLTKETTLFLLPAMLFIALHQRWRHQGRFAIAGWVVPLGLLVSLYPLYALLKGELLPATAGARFALFGGDGERVSLIEALQWQASRGGGGMFNLDNSFWRLVRNDWLVLDPVLMLGGASAVALNLVRGLRNRSVLAAALLGLLPLLYLARGGVVFSYYIVFAIPFLALNLGMLLSSLADFRFVRAFAPIVASVLVVGFYSQALAWERLYTRDSSEAGRRALAWIKQHLPPESKIITRDDLLTDLREPLHGTPSFPHAHSHWKVAADPEVHSGIFDDDWRSVDYLIMSPGLESAFADTGNEIALDALDHASPVKRWEVDKSVVELWKVNKSGATEAELMSRSASYISRRFERSGAYIASDGTVTSEAQAYALLRAVWSDDRTAFYAAWDWTRDNLIDRRGLPAWQWKNGRVVDRHSATDADTDMALALLLASRRWGDAEFLAQARDLIANVWRREVADVAGTPYVAAGDWAVRRPVVALNPSYFSPYAYRLFAEVDAEHDWNALIDSGYRALFAASRRGLGAGRSTGLPPDWIGVERATGRFVPLQLPGRDTTSYGYDAARTYWRVALDLRWSGDGRAEAYLQQSGFLRDEVRRKGYVSAVYSHDGRVMEEPASLVSTAGAVAALLERDVDAAHALYARQIVGTARRAGDYVHWWQPDDLYAQEWGWFVTALYADELDNLWAEEPVAADLVKGRAYGT